MTARDWIRPFLIAILAVSVSGTSWGGGGPFSWVPELETASSYDLNGDRNLSPEEVERWSAARPRPERVDARAPSLSIFEKYGLGMAPIVLDSNQPTPEGYRFVRNLNHGGVPWDSTTPYTVLVPALVPESGVEEAAFIIEHFKVFGRNTGLGAHGMMYFRLTEDRPVRVLDGKGHVVAESRELILSVEAWRLLGEAYDFIAGLKAGSYGLTYRWFTAEQRRIEDNHKGDEGHWILYPLRLSQKQLDLLLRSALDEGDRLARSYLDYFRRGDREGLTRDLEREFEDYRTLSASCITEVQRLIRRVQDQTPEDAKALGQKMVVAPPPLIRLFGWEIPLDRSHIPNSSYRVLWKARLLYRTPRAWGFGNKPVRQTVRSGEGTPLP